MVLFLQSPLSNCVVSKSLYISALWGKCPCVCTRSVLYEHNVHSNYELYLTSDRYRQLMIPYLSATTGAVGTALVLNKVAKVRQAERGSLWM